MFNQGTYMLFISLSNQSIEQLITYIIARHERIKLLLAQTPA